MRASTEECIAVCSAGPDVCLGINWLPLNPEPTRCMLQALAKTPQAAVEAAVGAKMNWWWAQGTATEGPPVKALDHGNGDWTASASCWVRASFATGGGLGWSFVLLLLLSAAGYLSVRRWPGAAAEGSAGRTSPSGGNCVRCGGRLGIHNHTRARAKPTARPRRRERRGAATLGLRGQGGRGAAGAGEEGGEGSEGGEGESLAA